MNIFENAMRSVVVLCNDMLLALPSMAEQPPPPTIHDKTRFDIVEVLPTAEFDTPAQTARLHEADAQHKKRTKYIAEAQVRHNQVCRLLQTLRKETTELKQNATTSNCKIMTKEATLLLREQTATFARLAAIERESYNCLLVLKSEQRLMRSSAVAVFTKTADIVPKSDVANFHFGNRCRRHTPRYDNAF